LSFVYFCIFNQWESDVGSSLSNSFQFLLQFIMLVFILGSSFEILFLFNSYMYTNYTFVNFNIT